MITQEQIDTLPMADRQPASLVLLLPGTNMDNTQVRRSQANIGAGGINNQMNAYFLDGASNWSTNSGQQHAEMPQLAIREFRVNVAQASAEHGGNVAGLVSIVTRSGTNRFSGEALEYFKNQVDAWRATRTRKTSALRSPITSATSGACAFGGPIVRDKVHFYGAIEYQTENKSFTVNSGQPQFYSKLEGVFPTNYLRHKLLRARRLAGHAVAVRVCPLRQGLGTHRLRRCGGTNAAFNQSYVESPAHHERGRAHVGRQQPRAERVPRAVSRRPSTARLDLRERRCGIVRASSRPSASTATTQVYNFPSMHWGSSTASLNFTKRFELKEDYSYSAGSHQLKFGAEYARYISPEDVIANLGTWTFTADQFFDGTAASIAALRSPTTFTAVVPERGAQAAELLDQRVRAGRVEAAQQRDAQPRRPLRPPVPLVQQPAQLRRPRVAEAARRSRPAVRTTTTSVRASAWRGTCGTTRRRWCARRYGRFYQYCRRAACATSSGRCCRAASASRTRRIRIRTAADRRKSFVTVSARPNVNTLDDRIHNMSGDTVTAGVSQQLMPNLALHVDGVYTNLRDFARTQNINQPNTGIDTGSLDAATAARIAAFTAAQLNALRPMANWGNVTQLSANGWSRLPRALRAARQADVEPLHVPDLVYA